MKGTETNLCIHFEPPYLFCFRPSPNRDIQLVRVGLGIGNCRFIYLSYPVKYTELNLHP